MGGRGSRQSPCHRLSCPPGQPLWHSWVGHLPSGNTPDGLKQSMPLSVRPSVRLAWGPASKVIFQTHQGLEAIPRSPSLLLLGTTPQRPALLPPLGWLLSASRSSECPLLHAADSNEGRREAACSLPDHDPERQSAHKRRHLGHPKSLERERAPGIIGPSSAHTHSGIHKLVPLQFL